MDVRSLFSLEGRTALVTGASSGLGAMIAEGLLCAGASVFICGRKEGPLLEQAKRLSAFGTCLALPADVSQNADRAALHNWIKRESGKLDILVNNAGTSWGAPLAEFPDKGFDKILSLNLSAPFFLVQQLLPCLQRAASVAAPARVINISSIDGLRPPDRETYSYSAAKAGLNMLTRHLAKRLAPDHIAVNAIAPGLFETNMTHFIFDPSHPAHEPPPAITLGKRAGHPEDIAGAAIYLASRASAHLTGVVLPVSGGEALID